MANSRASLHLTIHPAPVENVEVDILSAEIDEKSRQNEGIYDPDEFSTPWAQDLAISEYATAYNLPEEKEALGALKKRLKLWKKYASRERRMASVLKRWTVEEQKKKNKFISRASGAVFGGIAVITPMLIMSLHPTRLTQLLTASLFVVSVALLLAWLMDEAEWKDMIATTAAYAAVLVVFVGAATTTT
ncbi:hypothetical protein G7Y89_g12555 [Cudoniella acicularis]|uniref:DUF6594 domain-containing protein n=1 Tax=Cudoniella acicularis TaxID=354080 RepID=A0A8H4R8W8_9HELO|nr:hypothetical protein G7Y89_g12555 [Cudoniella acicularis]